MNRLAIVTTHPIQYYAPWFAYMQRERGIDFRVFYLWDFGVRDRTDPGFGHSVKWDISLLEGYDCEFVRNEARDAGTHHFWGIDNPRLPRCVAAYHADAVLCLGYNYASFFRLMLSPMLRKIPFLMRGDSHRLTPRAGLIAMVKRKLLCLAFKRFSAFLYVGEANRQYYMTHGVRQDRLFFSPHCVDNSRFLESPSEVRREAVAWRAELGISPDNRVILFVGKLEKKKRPQDLLRAFQLAQLAGVTLLFVGAGQLCDSLHAEAAGMANVVFAPFQNQTRMPRTYAAADLLVLPSYGSGETWGLCINEGMCLGNAAIVSSHVGCAGDLVHPGKNGLIFPAGDVEALSRCLRTAFADPEQLNRWGEVSRRIIAAYDYPRATDGLLSALGRLTAPRIASKRREN